MFKLSNWIINLRRCRSGVAAVEFAIIAPVLITLFGAAVDLGTLIDNAIRLENAARTGAQYATRISGTIILDPTVGAAAVKTATLAAISDWSSSATVTVSPSCSCPGVTNPTCTDPSTCSSGMQEYISVTVSHSASLFLAPFSGFNPIVRTVVARVL